MMGMEWEEKLVEIVLIDSVHMSLHGQMVQRLMGQLTIMLNVLTKEHVIVLVENVSAFQDMKARHADDKHVQSIVPDMELAST